MQLNKVTTDLLTTSFQPSSLFWPLLGLVRLSLLLGEVTGRAIVLNGEGKELESIVSGALQEVVENGFDWITTNRISFISSDG